MTLLLLAELSHQSDELRNQRCVQKGLKISQIPKITPTPGERKNKEGADYKCLEIIFFISIVLCFESRELVGPIPGPRLT